MTGAASGIGQAAVQELKRLGAAVASLDLNRPTVPVDRHIRTDLADPASIEAAVNELGSGWDGLLNIAGVPEGAAPETVIAVNFLGLRELTESLLGAFNPGASVVNVSSLADARWPTRVDEVKAIVATGSFAEGLNWFRANPPEGETYNFSKEAVTVYTMKGALAYVSRGIRVNGVRPGLTRTPLFAEFEQSIGEERAAGLRSLVGRHADPEDIASVIVFLASPESGWVNGQLIAVDGGVSAGIAVGDIPLPGPGSPRTHTTTSR